MGVDLTLPLAVQFGFKLRRNRSPACERAAVRRGDIDIGIQQDQPDAELLPGVDGGGHVCQAAKHSVHLGGNHHIARLQAIPQLLARGPVLKPDRESGHILVGECLIDGVAVARGPL